jgi:tRNA A37 threonylcarbamoyladenosine dehydratase
MGAGGKFDPGQVQVADLDDSYNCKLAYYMRKRLTNWASGKALRWYFHRKLCPGMLSGYQKAN